MEVLNEEDVTPQAHLYRYKQRDAFDPQREAALTRRILGISALAVLVLFYGALLILLVTNLIDMDQLTGLIAGFSGLQALVATAFGFYFGKAS